MDNPPKDGHESYIRQAFGLAFPSWVQREGRYLLVFDGYFDESGVHADSDTVAVAGFFSTVERWREFESEWTVALSDFDLDFFHMTDFAMQVRSYADWTEPVRRQRLGRLIRIIASHTDCSFGCSVSKKEWEVEIGVRTGGTPYLFLAQTLFLTISGYMNEMKRDAWAAYVMEDGARGKGEVLKAYDLMKGLYGDSARMLSIKFEGKRNFVPLQAADILAYELFKQHSNQVGKREPQSRMPFKLLYQLPHVWTYLGGPQLKAMSAVMDMLDGPEPV